MPRVIENKRLGDSKSDFFLMRVQQENRADGAKMGQFYMLRAWGNYPLLSRPISVCDCDGDILAFVYRVVGEGTELLSKLSPEDAISTGAPLGRGFPSVSGKVALVGGGVGTAPLCLAAKTLKFENPSGTVDCYLGFTESAILEDEFTRICDNTTVDIGGFITDRIDTSKYDCIFSCGPEIMMRVLQKKCAATATKHFASLESRMACGIGICLGCRCGTSEGGKKICTDGPVFAAEEVFSDD